MRPKSLLAGIVLVSVSLMTTAMPAAWSQPSDSLTAPLDAIASEAPPAPPQQAASNLDQLALPPVDEAMSKLASKLTEQLSTDAQFASAEIPADRTKVIIHWDGKKNAKLSKILSDEGVESIPVEVRQTKFNPGQLRKKANKLIESDFSVKSITPRHDASGLEISVDEKRQKTKSKIEIAREYENVVDVPVEVVFGAPAAVESRQSDNWHLGGARMYGYDRNSGTYPSACTSGFAVRETGTNREGLMFAAHCVHPNAATWTGDINGTRYVWGDVVRTNYPNDGAIIATRSYPLMWTASHLSDTYAPINGYGYGYVGQELCLSGSFTGLTCGNVVRNTANTYRFSGGYPTTLTGYKFDQISGISSLGQGDSGGPAYEIVSTSSGVKRVAIGIISAGSYDSIAPCRGVQSTPAEPRECYRSGTVSSVGQISTATGWYVPN